MTASFSVFCKPHFIRALLLGATTPLFGADTITAWTTQTTATSNTTLNTTGASNNVLDLTTGDNFTLNYAGELRTLSTFTAGSTNYAVTPVSYSVNLIRNPGQQTNEVVWNSYSSVTPSLTTAGNQNFIVNLPGIPSTTMESAFSLGSVNTGTDNLFTNTADSNGNVNNIERLDVIYGSALTSSSDLVFAIFERGTSTTHDSFKIAAILSTDGTGAPTSYGSLFTVSSGTWGTTNLEPANVIVQRNLSMDPGGEAEFISAYTSQFLGGISINAVSDLGVAAGTQILGYSLFGGDVTNSHNLLDPSTFPTNTSNTQGGLDVIGSFQASQAVPEPGSAALGAMGLILLALRRNRREI